MVRCWLSLAVATAWLSSGPQCCHASRKAGSREVLTDELAAGRLEVAEAAPAPSPDIPINNCDDIQDVVIRGKDWTNIVGTVCNFWPPQFGKFPAESVSHLKKIIGKVFDEGGLWDKLRAIAVERSSKYCLRREATRYELSSTASANSCPQVLDEQALDEMPQETDVKKDLLEGYWACSNSTEGGCDCRKRDIFEEDVSTPFPVVKIASRPSGCAM